ncbi:phage head protein [Haemophilus influenzae]|uniref:head completion/stabilization protein n=1 Tax=Haemophilus influenzae TaxID=727 RepID=UPI0006802A5A|nr:head completion/stabilization protein [Haemophilus influenzae]KMZ24834.1 phage head protein [Haemophilus influenzae]
MSDGAISVKLALDYEMGEVQQQLNDYDTLDDIISNDGFFPDMSLAQFRNQYRADGTITTQRLQDALVEGMASVNAELSMFKTQSKHDSLEQITAPSINGESVLIYRYKRYASYDSTNDGEKKMTQLKDSIDELRRDARFAISDILGRKRVDAELI